MCSKALEDMNNNKIYLRKFTNHFTLTLDHIIITEV